MQDQPESIESLQAKLATKQKQINELLDGLRYIKGLCGKWGRTGPLEPRKPLSWESCGRIAITNADEMLTKTESWT